LDCPVSKSWITLFFFFRIQLFQGFYFSNFHWSIVTLFSSFFFPILPSYHWIYWLQFF
jgi:hypothetical protein